MGTSPPTGRKRRFGLAGVINIVATNALLQLLLASQSLSIGAATLISQVFNGCFGYAIYGGWVFRSSDMRRLKSGFLYVIMMSFLWVTNTAGIAWISGRHFAPNRGSAALIMIIPLAILSFTLQKHLIFKSTLKSDEAKHHYSLL